MPIFIKENGTSPQRFVPLKILKKFFYMSKFTTFNPVLKRNGQKNSHAIMYLRDINYLKSLG